MYLEAYEQYIVSHTACSLGLGEIPDSRTQQASEMGKVIRRVESALESQSARGCFTDDVMEAWRTQIGNIKTPDYVKSTFGTLGDDPTRSREDVAAQFWDTISRIRGRFH